MLIKESRIQHAEDIIFWEGSSGVKRVLKSFVDLQKEGFKDVTVKWDGSPAVIFGRDVNGDFILTDKSGFGAKRYDGKSKSGEDLEKMFLSRGKPDVPKSDSYKKFASKMGGIFDIFKNSVPENHRGFFSGDLLYFDTPKVYDNKFVFKPNVVTYEVDVESELGNKIKNSKVGIVIHNEVDLDGNSTSLKNKDIFKSGDLLVIPPVTIEKPVKGDNKLLKDTVSLTKSNSSNIDKFFDINELTSLKIKDLPNIFYTYINSKVDSGLENLGNDFENWVTQNSKLTDRKKQNVLDYINKDKKTFDVIWQIVSNIMTIKDEMIDQMESQNIPVKSYIGDYKGGEGYVMSHPVGNIKFVPRSQFSAVNRSIQREDTKLFEGGWLNPSLTSNTKLTPTNINIVINKFEKFLSELNDFLKTKELLPILDYKVLGSAKYYKQDLKDNSDIIYGDVDIMISLPKDNEDDRNKIKKEYSDAILDFISNSGQDYIDKESANRSKAQQIIINIGGDDNVQIDMLYTLKSNKDWFSARFSPERGMKGFTLGLLYTALAETLNLSIGDRGVIAKIKDDKIVKPSLRKGTIEKIISQKPKTFLMDIAEFLSKTFDKPLKHIDSDLESNMGIDEDNIKLEYLVKGIVGLSKTLDKNGILSSLNTNRSDFIDSIRSIYKSKLMDKSNKLVGKSNTPETIKSLEKIKQHADMGLKIVKSMLKEMRLHEGGNVFDDVKSFNKEDAKDILNTIQSTLPSVLKIFPVGSAGHKDVSGDMDLMIDVNDVIRFFGSKDSKIAKQDLKKYFINNGLQSVVTGTNVHIRVPNNDEFVQADIMLVDDADQISKYHQHDYTSTKYKGFDKQIVLSSLAKYTITPEHPEGFVWSAFQGLKDRKTKEIVTKNIDEIAKILISPTATANDMRNVESILNKLNPEDNINKLKDARDTLSKKGIKI
jgi:hypothetical protein